MVYLGIRRNRVNDTQWVNTDNSSFDYGYPMGQAGHWPWCRDEPGGDKTNHTVVRIGPLHTGNASDPFENPRNYGCWQDTDGSYGTPYAICRKPVAGNVTESSRNFYYQPEGPPTETPNPKNIRGAGSSQEASVETGETEATVAERHEQRHPDRHA